MSDDLKKKKGYPLESDAIKMYYKQNNTMQNPYRMLYHHENPIAVPRAEGQEGWYWSSFCHVLYYI